MNTKTKIYIGITAVVLIAILGTHLWQAHKIAALETEVRDAKQMAEEKSELATAKELEAAEYKQKIEYLEQQLAGTQTKTRKQDEKLEKLNVNSRDARGDVERARNVRSVDTTASELCAKLAELGHACE